MKRFLRVVLLLTLLVGATGIQVSAQSVPEIQARQLLAQLTPEERIGQLFLVTFNGSEAGDGSAIYDLIARHHIGGVVLLAANDNFTAAPDTAANAYRLIARLQTIEWQASQGEATDASGQPLTGAYIPLLVGIPQNGDGYPDDQILNGLTPLPSEMALGATWNPALAEEVGTVAGRELAALGFNLFLGPSLDVLENPALIADNDLGARVFGGDPYWVGEMGRAYIRGLHQGSNGRLLVIASHFPGRGSADRPIHEEIATIRKSLEQLKQIELAPFFAVTGNAPDPQSVTDGLLLSHIRYQGFQGNIRATTRPVSFDQQALKLILDLPPLATWRQNGGLLVSDDLGTQAVYRFYAPSGQNFSARLVARDAFLAGNDLLYLGNITSSDAADNYQTVLRILDFFSQKYREDTAFAQRVDESVLRILTYKFRLYPRFELERVIPAENAMERLGGTSNVTFRVAQQAATLVSPDPADLDVVLPDPPGPRDVVLFLTDSRAGRQCSKCPDMPALSSTALRDAVLTLYGPRAGGQVNASRLRTYTFDDVNLLLQQAPQADPLIADFQSASWVVIAILDARPASPQGILLRRLLSERQDLLRNKRVILFAFEAPYYLDATDISKLTAYYALYSKSPPFIEMAARLLFQEMTATGAPPVSVPGIGYDLFTATMPDPAQVIALFLDSTAIPAPTPTATGVAEPTNPPIANPGDTIAVRTGIILDHNRHPVPDGTGVRFTLVARSDGSILQQIDTTTFQGVARATFRLERSGSFEIRAVSEPAMNSNIIQIDVSEKGGEVSVVTETPATSTAPTAVETATPTPLPLPPEENTAADVNVGMWFLVTLLSGGLSYLAFTFGKRLISIQWGVRLALCTLLGGVVGYNYLALHLPGSLSLLAKNPWGGAVALASGGALLGAVAGWLWWRLVNAPGKPSTQ